MCLSAHAASISLNNGGFEAGLTGWTIANEIGSDGTFFLQTGTTSPVNGDPVPAPPQGLRAAMTDAGAGGSHVLYQDFVVPASLGATLLTFDLFVGNRADAFRTPNHLDWFTPDLNQQARVDLLLGGTDPFSLLAADVVLNAFRTNVGDPLVSGYTHFSVDVTSALIANTGATLRLRFAEVDNVGPLQFGVDNVSFSTPTAAAAPEPPSLLLLLAAFIVCGACRGFRVQAGSGG
jgi:hypothetical protein